ncbi:signal peptide-containing protein [Theileria equi strain WA]|uniref:Signal peptide-containing protein n=1 Tax=Theileria equi strain WA TaxID=1537102 RepID=L0AXA3_THEEQ|nr:signal peptide-containing protein [Theileria equi strain WA]AFZ80212.1 signal peptide-containing protein [Theileria equi strain WA]|eukprot:XP_004829878.1 signal peptide-containing protein [Theileria equi strain WA]
MKLLSTAVVALGVACASCADGELDFGTLGSPVPVDAPPAGGLDPFAGVDFGTLGSPVPVDAPAVGGAAPDVLALPESKLALVEDEDLVVGLKPVVLDLLKSGHEHVVVESVNYGRRQYFSFTPEPGFFLKEVLFEGHFWKRRPGQDVTSLVVSYDGDKLEHAHFFFADGTSWVKTFGVQVEVDNTDIDNMVEKHLAAGATALRGAAKPAVVALGVACASCADGELDFGTLGSPV